MYFKKFYSKDTDMKITESDVFITHVDVDKNETKKFKEKIGSEYYQNKLRYKKNGNIRILNLEEKKKYMCFDADDKKSNDHVSSIMKKYGIKDNCYPSISNYFNHSKGENSHKYHYWFVTDKRITSHIHVNNTSLDVWGPNGCDTSHPWLQAVNNKENGRRGDGDNDSKRIIFEPNVEGLYLDTNKEYPMLTDEIYNDVMNININKGIFSNKGQLPSCMFHNDCIAFERNKYADLKSKMNNNKDIDAITIVENKYYKKVNFFSYMGENKKISEPSELLEHVMKKQNIEFKRDGYSPMSSYYKKQLQDYLIKNPNTEPLVLNDNSYGVICCVKTNNHNDPLIATVRMCNSSDYLSLPKGHRENYESEVESAIRETREEIGIDASKYVHPNLYTSIKYTIAYPMNNYTWKLNKDYPDESKRPFCVYYKEVKFFLAVFPEILELKPQPNEILECKWVPLSTFKKEAHADYSKTITDFFNSKNVKSKLYTAHAFDSTCRDASSKNKKMLPMMFLDKGLKKKNQDAIESKPKPQFNILDPFHLFNKKKSSEPSKDEPLQVQNKNNEPAKIKKLFGFLKK